ncbi:hypothetical protein G7B40_033435 [Aetokthonos hydrillicola Thurmond2011]|jgi:hypothetical protein|uniref:Uncharacterized protein n=1 Tax=Aetokthonos hydrillicola Thurmond2011 TaxID=2712845 RepID=A0AAP5IGK2_9CYAN|nr:hypothetical protein [Aetokthonos hydrillicola]MBO3459535.1 hypothetical protein [Aetokthonos hydrillicola CCALA 1050]MBW4590284.1 hypothetical protein [Aetokthonos hydrillicola CCALA 1050]MDR9899428.1 hypothetical protein [Aetokthonos hydrillicola Thurmond2011]
MHNLETGNIDNNPNTAKNYIIRVLNQLLIDYKNTREERRKLMHWEELKDFSILGEIEIFTTDIRGYASQITTNNFLENPQKTVEKLKRIQIFSNSNFEEWYFSSENEYPQLKNYIEKINYLRLLLIEYISQYNLITAA